MIERDYPCCWGQGRQRSDAHRAPARNIEIYLYTGAAVWHEPVNPQSRDTGQGPPPDTEDSATMNDNTAQQKADELNIPLSTYLAMTPHQRQGAEARRHRYMHPSGPTPKAGGGQGGGA